MRQVAVLTAAVLLLAGCTLAPQPAGTPLPTATVPALPSPPLGVVGSGTLDSAPFTITWDGEAFWLSGLNTLRATDATLVGLSTVPGIVGECLGGYARTYGPPFTMALQIGANQQLRDPTFLVSISTLGPYSGSCFGQPVVATAPINWTMQPLYPDLVVVDGGETDGATGMVTLDGDVAVAYQANQGDVLEEIAARFGLTTDQLIWLNPRRPNSEIVYKDETLNLSPLRR